MGSDVRRSTHAKAASRTSDAASHHPAAPPVSPPSAISSELTPANSSAAPGQSTLTGFVLRYGG